MANIRVFTFSNKRGSLLRQVTVTATNKIDSSAAVQNVLKGQTSSKVVVTGGNSKSVLG